MNEGQNLNDNNKILIKASAHLKIKKKHVAFVFEELHFFYFHAVNMDKY